MQAGVVLLAIGEGRVSALRMRKAIIVNSCSECGLPVMEHCEDINLTGKGQMNEGEIAESLGLTGIPAASAARLASSMSTRSSAA